MMTQMDLTTEFQFSLTNEFFQHQTRFNGFTHTHCIGNQETQELTRLYFLRCQYQVRKGYNIVFNGSQHGLLENLTLDLGRYGLKCDLRIDRNFLFIRQFLKRNRLYLLG